MPKGLYLQVEPHVRLGAFSWLTDAE